MKSILYISNAIDGISDIELHDLGNLSACKNRQLEITGYLSFVGNRFLQYIEGNPFIIDSLMDKIRKDSRHNLIYEIELESIHYRVFPHWDMRFMSNDDESVVRLEECIERNLLLLRETVFDRARLTRLIWQQLRALAAIRESKKAMFQSLQLSKSPNTGLSKSMMM